MHIVIHVFLFRNLSFRYTTASISIILHPNLLLLKKFITGKSKLKINHTYIQKDPMKINDKENNDQKILFSNANSISRYVKCALIVINVINDNTSPH